MGGYGSGQWYRYGSKTTIEAINSIDISYLKKTDSLAKGKSGTLSWTRNGHPAGSVGYANHGDWFELRYEYTPNGQGEPISVKQSIYFDYTPCHFGGDRIWFSCPHCGRRTRIIYSYGKYFTCRKCANLNYGSQHETPMDRAYRKARKHRAKLKTKWFNPNDLSERPIFKPKGMHQTTFDRLRWKEINLRGACIGFLSDCLDNIQGRISR